MTRRTSGPGGHPQHVDPGDAADLRPQKENSPALEGGHEEAPPGPVEAKVRADVEALVTAHPMGEALAEMSFNLARTLDQGAGLAVAAVNRELRANLVELARLGVDGDDDLDDQLSTPDMPSEVRDEEDA